MRNKEWCKKISIAKIGYKVSDETKRKISNSQKGKIPWNKGLKKPYPNCEICGKKLKERRAKRCRKCVDYGKGTRGKKFYGRKKGYSLNLTDEQKKRRSELSRGENSNFWKGGISGNPYPYYWTDTLKESIRQRDDYVCQECGIHQDELYRALDIHHIDYDKNNCDPNNLISLCKSCHSKTNTNRDYWIEYFTKQ